MTEKRFRKVMGFIQDNTCEGGDVEGVMDLTEIEDMLNGLAEENRQLKELINLIADACTYTKEHTVKDILRREIRGIDHAAEESVNAWHAYMILSNFFEEHYNEHWDNE